MESLPFDDTDKELFEGFAFGDEGDKLGSILDNGSGEFGNVVLALHPSGELGNRHTIQFELGGDLAHGL